MYKSILILLTCVCSIATAQVNFNNSSFEDTITGIFKTPPNWDICINSPDLQPYIGWPAILPSEGSTYIGLAANIFAHESTSQNLPNQIIKDSSYCFSIDIASMSPSLSGGNLGKLSIYIGDSSCNYDQLIFTSTLLDTLWNTYTVRFTADADYDYFTIRSVALPPDGSYLYIDNLSDYGCDTTAVRVVEEREPMREIKAFPNPTFDILTIQWEIEAVKHLTVYNNLGQLIDYIVLKDNVNQHILDVSKYPAGLYHLQLEAADTKLHTNFTVKR